MGDVGVALSEGRVDLPRTGEIRAGNLNVHAVRGGRCRRAEVDGIGRYLRDLTLRHAKSADLPVIRDGSAALVAAAGGRGRGLGRGDER